MNDPFSRAPDEAPERRDPSTGGELTVYPTEHAPPLGTVLDGLREQLLEALALPFFDGGSSVQMTPVTKHALSEAGAATIVARKREPVYEATVALEVCSDHQSAADRAETGRYQVSARAHLRCEDAGGRRHRDVRVTVQEIGGSLQLDVPHLRAEMTAAIHAIGGASAAGTP
jgi:hypothetical protein